MECRKCLYNKKHPFGLSLTNNICSGCVTHEEKYTLNWSERKNNLEDIFKKYRSKGSKYDCVVPVIGDAEDFYTLSIVLEFGLSPLVVCVNDYFKNDIGWHNFHQLITCFDVDSITFNPEINVYKDLVRTSLRKNDHILLPFLQLHTSYPVHIAYERKIPLVIWGQNQAIEQVGKFSHLDSCEMSRWNRKQHDLFETEIKDLIGNGAQVSERALNYYEYPSPQKLSQRGTRGLYLSNYMPWDPLKQNDSVKEYGFLPESSAYTFDIYERSGSSVYYQIHDLLKYKRVGYRKITDHLSREIRHKRINRSNALQLQKKFAKRKVNIEPFLKWLGATKSGIEWLMKHKFNDVHDLISFDKQNYKKINITKEIDLLTKGGQNPKEEFILFGKGIDI